VLRNTGKHQPAKGEGGSEESQEESKEEVIIIL
jgi:hypothetical protein